MTVVPAPAPPPPSETPHAAPEVVLRTQGLVRAFGQMRAVDGVDLELWRGEVYGFLGRNGAGKTTTLRMLVGILRPDAGSLELEGRRLTRVTARERERLGYVSQEQVFYPWMTARQLGRFVRGFYPRWDDAEFERLLRVLDVPPERRAAQLSGGTRTKLGLALALAHRPALLLLDEPTAGLDPVARHEFLELLAAQVKREGVAALFSSHLVSEVEQVAHRVGILQDGRLRFQGPLEALRQSVRRVRAPEGVEGLEGLPPPPGFTLVRREKGADGRLSEVWHAEAQAWEALRATVPLAVEPLSLEAAFLAYARRSDET